ncbi:MAG: hypothetical protein ABI255_04470 [Microbacteriaceae bacterium]
MSALPPAASVPVRRQAGQPAQRPRIPWWLSVSLIFVAARAVSTVLILILASVQGRNPWTLASPGYFDFATIWDGRWYNIVQVAGYPSQLPLTATGQVGENAWAFLPGYPGVVSAVMFVTGLPWPVASVVVSFGFGLAAALLFYRLMRLRLGASTALFAVVLFCVAPVSPLFQLSYAESMYLALLTLALYLLLRRRYWWLVPVVIVMGFTRPSGLAFALALGLHVVYRWWVRARDPFPMRERAASVVVTGVAVLAGIAWPAIAGVVTGEPMAYFDTELAWRSVYIGYQDLIPFTAWFQGGNWWLGFPLGAIVVTALILAFSLTLFLPAVRRLGVDLRLWLASYALYVLAVFFPQSSTFRILMPMFPLAGAAAVPESRIYRVLLVLACIAGQWGWLLICWGVDGQDWTPP